MSAGWRAWIAAAALIAVGPMAAGAAVSSSADKQLATGGTNEGGTTTNGSGTRQYGTIGGAVATNRLSSARFRIISGVLGAGASGGVTTPPADNLSLQVLYAKTDPLGSAISPQSWQRDRDPIFYWEPPPTGPELAGYSYAIDTVPDDTIDTSATSFNMAAGAGGTLADGTHTFSVRAVNTGGSTGPPLSFDIWVDTTAPQITAYAPGPGTVLNALGATVEATITDGASGVTSQTLALLINGAEVPVQFQPAAGQLIASGGAWREGVNSIELRAADAVGNAQTPQLWSVTMDTVPPEGAVVINGGAVTTTSVHVTLSLSALDATSGVAGMRISNTEASGYVEEPFTSIRTLWRLNPVRGEQSVYVQFVDAAGNISAPVSDSITVALLSPETVISQGPAGVTGARSATFGFMCPEGGCVFAVAFDGEPWSAWSATSTATRDNLVPGNHYFRVKAAKEVNGLESIQPDEEDPSPAERTWIIGVEPSAFIVPRGPPIKLWRLE